jgi:Skp family chaperone for outer membrane proteins
MPKSRQRKNHKAKVQSRNKKVEATKKLYSKMMNEEMQKYLDKLSGMTETQSMEEVSGPVQ